MDFSMLSGSLQSTLGASLPGIIGAIAMLAIGWIIAVIVRATVRKLLSVAKLNQHVEDATDQKMDMESGIASGLFWFVILITAIGVFNVLHLEIVSGPFQVLVTTILGYLPRLAGGLILLLVAWGLAMALRIGVTKGLAATSLDDKLAKSAGMQPVSKNIANVLFWLVILLFLPAVLDALGLQGLMAPIQSMIGEALEMVPNLFAAVVIGVVGWLIAKVLRGLVTSLLAASGIDKFSQQQMDKSVRLSEIAGMIVFILVLFPAVVAALDALKIEAISQPAKQVLQTFLNAVPNIIAAAIILVVTFYIVRIAADAMAKLLSSMGLDALPAKAGMGDVFGKTNKPSQLVGKVLLFFAMLFATVEASDMLGLTQVRDLLTHFIEFGANIVLGTLILAVGFWLASLIYNAVKRASGSKDVGLANIARVAVLGLVLAMGLRAMGIADDIVNLAFALTLGSVAVAVALAFGLGGREAAGRQLEHWFSKWRKDG